MFCLFSDQGEIVIRTMHEMYEINFNYIFTKALRLPHKLKTLMQKHICWFHCYEMHLKFGHKMWIELIRWFEIKISVKFIGKPHYPNANVWIVRGMIFGRYFPSRIMKIDMISVSIDPKYISVPFYASSHGIAAGRPVNFVYYFWWGFARVVEVVPTKTFERLKVNHRWKDVEI